MTFFADIEGSEGKIERKVKPIPVPGLLRLESCELFGIAYAELNLEAGAVETDDLFQSSCRCRWRKYRRGSLRFQPTDHDTYVAFQCPRVYDRRVTSGFVSFGILIYE